MKTLPEPATPATNKKRFAPYSLDKGRVPIYWTHEHRNCPENPRDFDLEGSQAIVLRELADDLKDYPEVKSYTVLDVGPDQPFAIWREL